MIMRDVKVNPKYCKTAMDTIEFAIDLEGMENISFDETTLPNNNNKSIVTIQCTCGKVKGSISAVHCIRDTNEYSFGIKDCVHMELVRCKVFDFIKNRLREHLGEQYSESQFEKSRVTSLEINTTLSCVGKATPSDMAHLFDMVFNNTTVYRKRKSDSKCEKEDTGIKYEKKHYYIVRPYDKVEDLRRQHIPFEERNLFRLEIIFKDRKLNSIFGKHNRSLENILSVKAFDLMCKEYKIVLEDIIEHHIKPYLNNCVETLYQNLMQDTSGKSISDTVCRYKEIIVDLDCLRKALHKWYQSRQEKEPTLQDNTDEIIYKYRKKNLGLPEDVLSTLRKLHEAAG